MVKTQFLGEMFHWKRRVCIHSPIAGRLRLSHRVDQLVGRVEFGEQTVDWRGVPHLTSVSGTRVRISKIEIIGRKRMNKNNSARKSPIVPANVAQSHTVG